jgi:hypothetical protein
VSFCGDSDAAGLSAVCRAQQALDEGTATLALVASVEVGAFDPALGDARRAGRILGSDNSFGSVAAEAACVLLLASEEGLNALGYPSRGRILASAEGFEETPWGAPTPVLGRGLTRVVQQVKVALKPERTFASVLCNLTGERPRTDEWGFCLPRLKSMLADPGRFVSPVHALGHTGAASGPLLLSLASGLHSQRQGAVGLRLIWTSSAGARRAAVAFEPQVHTAACESTPPLPPWAASLDDELIAELLDEAEFAFTQRQISWQRAAEGDFQMDERRILRTEASLETIVRGLVQIGERGWQAALGGAEDGTPARVYTAMRVLLAACREQEATDLLLQQAGNSAPLDAALELSVEHAQPSAEATRHLVGGWLESPSIAAGIALSLAAQAGMEMTEPQLRATAERLDPNDARASVAFLRGLSRFKRGDVSKMIAKFQHSPQDEVRQHWAVCLLAGGSDSERRSVVAWAKQDPGIILQASAAAMGAERRELSLLARSLSGAQARFALGVLGDHQNVELLIEDLRRDATRQAAALALRVLLGRAPETTRLEPDEDETAPPRQIPCLSLEPNEWQTEAKRVREQGSHDSGLRAGKALGPASTLELMACLHLPAPLRQALSRELCLRWQSPGGEISVRDLWVRQMQRQREAAQHFQLSPLEACPPN